MNKIRQAFDENGKAFIPFITCGDPDVETTMACVREMVKSGADLIELGIPFSDPTAEGPVIQGANLRALTGGVTTDRIFEMVRELRGDVAVPMVFMTYANVVFSYGAERFISTCAGIGIDGLILPDLPFEEKEEFLAVCRAHGVALISLIAPTSANRVGGGLYLPGFQSRRDGRAQQHYDRPGPDYPHDPGEHGRSLRRRLWHLEPGAGENHGKRSRRGHCRLGHRKADRAVREGRGGSGRRVCERDEGRGQMTSE